MDIEPEFHQPMMYWQNLQQAPADYTSYYSSFQTPEPPRQTQTPPTEPQSTFAPTDPAIRNGSKKRRACNECKQQKLRCDLSTLVNPTAQSCSRCKRLGLECRIDRSFRRERKRKRSDELEKEVDSLKQELSRRSTSAQALGSEKHTDVGLTSQHDTMGSDSGSSRSMHHRQQAGNVFPTSFSNMTTPESTHGVEPPVATNTTYSSDIGSGRNNLSLAHFAGRGPQTLENVRLSADVIDELFNEYFAHYHPFLPILDARASPEKYLSSSVVLFWAIVSVASRRYDGDPTLLSRLARPVTDLTWKNLQGVPLSKYAVQALALLCTWPFPVSSSTADVSYMWSGLMVQIGMQMGLHRPFNTQDFTRNPVQLDESEVYETVRTWAACNIVAQSVSVGHGLAAPAQYDWTLVSGSHSGFSAMRLDRHLDFRLRVEMFRDQVTRSMTSSLADPVGLLPTHERLPLYRMLSQQLESLESSADNLSDLDRFHLLAARFHLQLFCLFDEPFSEAYTERILMLHFTATSLIQHTLETSRRNGNNFRYFPFYSIQMFVAASFTLLKVLKNDYFTSFIDSEAGNEIFQTAVNAIRTTSIADNDLPSRLAGVLVFLWSEVPSYLIGGQGRDGLQLQIRSRSSMSLVHDSLWRWREHFRTHPENGCIIKEEGDEQGISNESTSMEEAQHFVAVPPPFGFFDSSNYNFENIDFGLLS